jgi:hypothetical protein
LAIHGTSETTPTAEPHSAFRIAVAHRQGERASKARPLLCSRYGPKPGLARCFLRLDHVARFIVNTNHGIV